MTVGWFMKALAQFADFHSRARRREFWWFVAVAYLVEIALLSFTAVTVASAMDGTTLDTDEVGLAGWIMLIGTAAVALILVIPYWAVTVRRLHDTDHSAWWAIFLVIFPVLIWIFACIDGTPGPNRYGPDPKELERPGVA